MCYFPKCDRTQGVDYTNTELNLHFGRIDDKGKIKEMNEDIQNCDEVDTTNAYHILEGEARAKFRKWDNVKYITEIPKSRSRTKKSYSNKNWGMEIKTNNRLDPKDGEGIRFGVVVTLKEINGINRIDEFIKNCTLNGWLVNKVDIKTRIDIHERSMKKLNFSKLCLVIFLLKSISHKKSPKLLFIKQKIDTNAWYQSLAFALILTQHSKIHLQRHRGR